MKKKYLFILCLSVVALSIILTSETVNAATCEGVETSIISCDDNESGIGHILGLVIDILSIGVGILAVIGIIVSGIQYITAGGNEEQTRKSKRRITELVIGLALFVVGYGLLSWLLPGGSLNPSDLPHYDTPEHGIPDPEPEPEPGSGGGTNPPGGGGSTPGKEKCTAFNGWIGDSAGTIEGYYLNIPEGATDKTPIIVYLHGGGEAGVGSSYTLLSALQSVKDLFSTKKLIAVIPHGRMTYAGAYNEWQGQMANIKNLADGSNIGKQISEKLSSCGGTSGRDKYIMGMSDGANATWTMVQTYPDYFRAASPVAGPGPYVTFDARKYSKTRIVAVCGGGDGRKWSMSNNVNNIRGLYPSMDPFLVLYGNLDHGQITASIKYGQLFDCLLSTDNSSVACTTFRNSG